MKRLTVEQQEVETFIRATAQQAQTWQHQITENEELELWMQKGNWDFLKRKVLDEMEMDAFRTIKNPAFDPTDFSQVSQFRALCQTIDLIRTRIDQRLATVTDARAQLLKLETDTTLQGGRENGNED